MFGGVNDGPVHNGWKRSNLIVGAIVLPLLDLSFV